MDGQFSWLTWGVVIFGAALVIALSFLASPLIAVGVLVVAGAGLLVGMAALRRRSEGDERSPEERVEERRQARRSTRDSRPATGGAPVSGEGGDPVSSEG